MIETQRQAYLEAMGIPVWVPKAVGEESHVRLTIASGAGSTLLVCRDGGERSNVIVSDIDRYLGNERVWAWPATDQDANSLSLQEAVDQKLFTRIVIFGTNLAQWVFNGDAPPVVGSAQTVVCADLDELALSGSSRKALWLHLNHSVPSNLQ
jgi:hypothetical protein